MQPNPGGSLGSDELQHALGVVEAHDGDHSLRVAFNLRDDLQEGNPLGRTR
jgi:hypothetical protein